MVSNNDPKTEMIGAVTGGDDGQLLIHNVPRDLKNQFKIACIRNNTCMRVEVMKFMKDYSEKNPGGA